MTRWLRRLLWVLRRAAVLAAATGLFLALLYALGLHPPPRWDPLAPLDLDASPTAVTRLKLMRADHDGAYCRAALAASQAIAEPAPDEDRGGGCGLVDTVRLSKLSEARLRPVRTRCAVAARLYLWEKFGLQPAAQAQFGAAVAEIAHFDSYSCRRMRTSRGDGARLSQHATANAIDIAGFTLTDGKRLSLKTDWRGADPAAQAFLRAAHAAGCARFAIVLGPDYNALHADHFHVDLTPRARLCR